MDDEAKSRIWVLKREELKGEARFADVLAKIERPKPNSIRLPNLTMMSAVAATRKPKRPSMQPSRQLDKPTKTRPATGPAS